MIIVILYCNIMLHGAISSPWDHTLIYGFILPTPNQKIFMDEGDPSNNELKPGVEEE